MRKAIIAAVAATMLLGCGKDSTGPGDGNPNPDPKRYVIAVNGDVFSPNVLPESSSQPVYVGDWIVWQVDDSDTGQHQVTFTNVPAGVTLNDSDTLTAGLADSVAFVKAGTYEYADAIGQGTGVITISALP